MTWDKLQHQHREEHLRRLLRAIGNEGEFGTLCALASDLSRSSGVPYPAVIQHIDDLIIREGSVSAAVARVKAEASR